MITKVQNSPVLPTTPQNVESFDSNKNEVSIETLQSATSPEGPSNMKSHSQLGKIKMQAGARAKELNEELDKSADSFLEQDNLYKTSNY